MKLKYKLLLVPALASLMLLTVCGVAAWVIQTQKAALVELNGGASAEYRDLLRFESMLTAAQAGVYRTMTAASAGGEATSTPHPLAPFMAAHGILSLLVFLLLVAYSYLAFVADRRGRHFFHDHPGIAWSFLGLWVLSVGSGWALYAINYL